METNPFVKKGSSAPVSEESMPLEKGSIANDDYRAAPEIPFDAIFPGELKIPIDGVEFVSQSGTTTIPIPNPSNFKEKTQSFVSTENGSHAMVGRTLEKINESPEQSTFVLIELEKGRYAGHASVEGTWIPLDLHSSGKQVITRSNIWGFGGQRKLNLFNLGEEGLTSLSSWEPYGSWSGNRDVKWAAFAAGNQIVTFGGNNTLVLWSTPEIKPVAMHQLPSGILPVMTPGGNYIVFCDNKEIGFIDVITHRVVARIPCYDFKWGMMSVSQSGKQLAYLYGNTISVWNLEKAELYREITLRGFGSSSKQLEWIDESNLLVDAKYLVDIENRVQLWTYNNAFAALGGSGYCWFFIDKFKSNKSGMAGAPIPHGPARVALKSAMSDDSYFSMKPGTAVTIDVSGIPDSTKQMEARTAIEANLKKSGFIIAANSAVTATLSVTRGDPQDITFRDFFALPNTPGSTHRFTPYISTVKFEEKGVVIHEFSSVNITPISIKLERGQSIAEAVKSHERADYRFFGIFNIPSHVPRPFQDEQSSLGSTDLVIQ